MATQNTALCEDPTMSNTVCPKFCNKCPLVCYHCDSSVRNYMDCNTTRTCQTGEQCLLHQLDSSRDGHREYKMNCASMDICDGQGLMLLGRRNVHSRNLITQCCSNDLCNYPTHQQSTTSKTYTVTTSTALHSTSSATPSTSSTQLPSSIATTHADITHIVQCHRDIEILIEDSKDRSSSRYIIGYLKDLVSQIHIGTRQNQIGVALYDDDVHNKFSLNDHTSQAELLKAIDDITFHHDDNDIDKGDVLSFLEHKLHDNHQGDRPDFKSVVIIMVDHFAHRRNVRYLFHHEHHITALSSISKDVIVINIGANGAHSVFSALASGASHVVDVQNYSTLTSTLPRVLSLLCA